MCFLPTAPAARTTSVIVCLRRSSTQPVMSVAKLLADGDVKHPEKPCSSTAKLFTIEMSCTIAPEKTWCGNSVFAENDRHGYPDARRLRCAPGLLSRSDCPSRGRRSEATPDTWEGRRHAQAA